MKLQDYIHYYLKSEVGFYIFSDKSITDGFLDRYKKNYPNGVYAPILTFNNYDQVLRDGYKLILRKLQDITDEECLEINKISPFWVEGTSQNYIIDRLYVIREKIIHLHLVPVVFHYLLKQGFDLFSLIENQLALDAKTLK